MIMKNIGKLFGAITIIFGVILMMSSFLFIDIDEKDKKVPCYDRFSNKIIGETCIEKADGLTDEFFGFFMVGVIMFFFGFLFNVTSFDGWDEPPTNFFGFAVNSEQEEGE